MSNQLKKILLIFFPALLIVLIAYILHQSFLSAQIAVSVAPGDSSITINNKAHKAGLFKVRPGTYAIKVSHPGFTEVSQTIEVIKGQKKFVGYIMTPNSSSTASWYQTHPKDQQIIESISGQVTDQSSKDQIKRLGLIKELPLIDQLFRIDYGQSLQHPKDPTAIAIYIKYYSETGKQQALDWIKFKGYDPSKLEIIYKNAEPTKPNPINAGE